MDWRWLNAAGLAVLLIAVSPHALLAQAPRPYDGIQAGYDAWRLAEEQRQAAVAEQLRLNDELKFWSGLPTSRGEVLDYYYADPYAGRAPAYGYEYGYASPWGRSVYREQTWVAPAWSVAPVERIGIGYARPLVRQPVGRVEVQTGPNRWESHPVYDPPLPDIRPSPPVDSPWLDGTPYATPRPAPAVDSRPAPVVESRPAPRAVPPPPVPQDERPRAGEPLPAEPPEHLAPGDAAPRPLREY